MDVEVMRNLHAVYRSHFSAVALRLEAEPAVPRADVQNPLARQVGWNRVAFPPFALPNQVHDTLDHGAIRQFEAVVPALPREVGAEIVQFPAFLPERQLLRGHYSFIPQCVHRVNSRPAAPGAPLARAWRRYARRRELLRPHWPTPPKPPSRTASAFRR